MKYYSSEAGGRVIVIRLNRGDLLRESIERAIHELDIRDGTLVCGYGTLDNCTLHMINTVDEFPAKEDFPTWTNYPLELVSMTGVIADGAAHIHATISDKGKAIGGHLEPGCTVIYLAEVVIYEHKHLQLTRRPTDWGPLALEEKEHNMNSQKIKFHHIAIRARDYEASKEFYTKALHANCYAEWKHPKGFMACMMELSGGGIIEMLGCGDEPLPENFENRSGCYIHLALEVEDVEAAVAEAVKYGGVQKGEIRDNQIPSPMHIGVVYGPSGEIIEFLKQI